MERFKYILLVFSLLFSVGCTKEERIAIPLENYIEESEPEEIEVEVEETAETEEVPEEIIGRNDFSKKELENFTQLFNTPEYLGFLITPFNSVEDIDYDSVFYFGAGIKDTIKEGEREDYLEATKQKDVYGDLQILRADSIKTYLETHLGISDFVAPKHYYWDYIESRDTYYYYHWDSEYDDNKFKCISGEKDENTYSLRFRLEGSSHYGKKADRILVFTEVDGNYIIKSNSIQWLDFSDESHSFDIKMQDSDELLQLITYEPDCNNNTEIIIVKGGKFLEEIYTDYQDDDINYYLKRVKDVSFFDYNADGIDDILIIGEYLSGDRLILEESVPNEYVYETCYRLQDKISEDLGEDLSIENVKKVLLGDNEDCTFDNYKDAYAHIARLSNMMSENLSYGLIYADNDDIPELVVDTAGYRVMLYTFENNHLTCLMYEWAYGAFGNVGYYYAPRKGVFYNLNNDYAGRIKKEYFMLKHPGEELKADFYKVGLWFNDLDGDGNPSQKEEEASDEWKEYEAEYYNNSNTEMTEQEVEAQIKKYAGYNYKQVSGDMNYAELTNRLK